MLHFLALTLLIILSWTSTSAATVSTKPSLTTWSIALQGNPTWVRGTMITDLFDTSATDIKKWKNKGSHVICYFSAGTEEDWRPDAGTIRSSAIGNALGDWPGEHWVDLRDSSVRARIATRMDLAVSRGCSGIDLDNVDSYTYSDTGFPLTYADALDYHRYVTSLAHARGLTIGLKNSPLVIQDVGLLYDFFINEGCYDYTECSYYEPMRRIGKPIYIIEYRSYDSLLCRDARRYGYALGFFSRELDTAGRYCGR